MPGRSHNFTDKERSRMIELYNGGRGLNPTVIGRRFGCSSSPVISVLTKAGVYVPGPPRKKRNESK